MEKYGLVLEGGGVRGSYTAGALAWLMDHDIYFDYHNGVSSGAIYLLTYLSDRKDTMYTLATKYACEPQNVGIEALIKEHHYVAYDRLFERDLIEKEHLTVDKIKEKGYMMEVGCYDLGQGKTIWFNTDDLDNSLDLIRGSSALPIASAVVETRGMRLLDGGITKMIPIERAVEMGCTKTMVITTKAADYVRKPSSPIICNWMKLLYRDCPQAAKDYSVRHLNYYKQIGMVKQMAKEGSVLHVYPSVNVSVSRWKGDPVKCTELYNIAYQDMENRKEEIFKFLGRE